MVSRASNIEAVNRQLDIGSQGSELHAVIKARQWAGAASLINENSARFKQWGRLPLHWAAIKKAPANIIEGLLVAYPEGARVKDSCPQVVPADLSKHPPTQRMIRQCAVDPIGWRAALVADCVDSGERAHQERNYDTAIASYYHGLRVVPTHERLQEGLLNTRKLQSDERVTSLLAWQKGG